MSGTVKVILFFTFFQSDVGRKPQGQISLDDSCRVWRADGAATFEISTSKKTHYLTADSSGTVDEWVRILQNVVRRNTTRILLGREDQKPTLEGWIVKVKHGHSKRCWCMLVGKTFLYFKAPTDQVNHSFNLLSSASLYFPFHVHRFHKVRSACETPASKSLSMFQIPTAKKPSATRWLLRDRPI